MAPKVPPTSWIAPFLEVRESRIHGKGVFTSQKILRGSTVIRWGGRLFTYDEVHLGMAKAYSTVPISEDLYLGSGVDEELGVDDYMNHSCVPNVGLADELSIVAIKDINPGEELVADYAIWLADESYVMKQRCNCGNIQCRGEITGRDWQLAQVQKDNDGHFSPLVRSRIEKLLKRKG